MAESSNLIAVIGLASAVVGGAIQAFAARSFEKSKFIKEAKWELYSHFYRALGEVALSEKSSERYVNANSLLIQIRGRIGMVGSADVIRAVGDVFHSPDLSTEEGSRALTQALIAMRKDVGGSFSGLSEDEMARLSFDARGQKQ